MQFSRFHFSLFDRSNKTHYRATTCTNNTYGHSFGGDSAADRMSFVGLKQPLHLLFRLSLIDPSIPVRLPGIQWLPLCYHFGYSAFDGTCVYRVLDDCRIELIYPETRNFDPNFPFPKFPRNFPRLDVCFERIPYDPTNAADALSLAAVFGVDELPPDEMEKAIRYVDENTNLIRTWCGEKYGWEPAHVVESMYIRPFTQGSPSRECKNQPIGHLVRRRTCRSSKEWIRPNDGNSKSASPKKFAKRLRSLWV